MREWVLAFHSRLERYNQPGIYCSTKTAGLQAPEVNCSEANQARIIIRWFFYLAIGANELSEPTMTVLAAKWPYQPET